MKKEDKLFESLLKKIRTYLPQCNETRIREAFGLAQEAHKTQKRESGEAYVCHPLEVTYILTEYFADEDCLIAALLHDTVEDQEHISAQKVEKLFGKTVRHLVEGVTKIESSQIKEAIKEGSQLEKPHDAETIRKIFLQSQEDIRIILIKLADRLHNMRTLTSVKDKAKQKAKTEETLNIFVRVAQRLGIWKMKNDLETECLNIAHTQQAQEIKNILENHKKITKKLIHDLKHSIEKADQKNHIQNIHVYQRSLYTLKCLQDRGKELHPGRTFNLFITTKNEERCYTLLKILHQVFPTRTLEEDFISNPRENGYQAYHINIVTEEGYKVQIRLGTKTMYQRSMYGITYDLFQQKTDQEISFLLPLNILNKQTQNSPDDFLDAAKSDLLQDKIEIHCEGKSYFIPEGASVLDAIFHIYDHKALHTMRIILNHKEVPFNLILEHTGVLKAEFSNRFTVDFSWFYQVYTVRARISIQEALRKWDHDKKVEVGHQMLQKEFDLYGKGNLNTFLSRHKKLIRDKFQVENNDDLLTRIGEGSLKTHEVLEIFFPDRKKSIWGWIDKIEDYAARILFRRRKSSIKLNIQAFRDKEASLLQSFAQLAEKFNISVYKNTLIHKEDSPFFLSKICCRAENKSQLHNFLTQLEQQPGIAKIRPRLTLSVLSELTLVSSFALAMWIFLIYAFFQFKHSAQTTIFTYGIIFPTLVANFMLYHFLSDFFPSIRKSLPALLINFGINILAIGLYTYGILVYRHDTLNLSFLLPLTLLVVFLIGLTAVFLRHYTLYSKETIPTKTLSPHEWQTLKRKKIEGYLIRLGAVAIWGFQPLIMKYTVINTVDPLFRITYMGLGGFFCTLFCLLVKNLWTRTKFQWSFFRIPTNHLLALMVIGQGTIWFLMNSSLLYTSGTNTILINNFAPVLSLIVAVLLWRNQIPYLKQKKHILAVFGAFVLGSIGSTLIFYNDFKHATPGNLYGDFLAMLMMIVDVIAIIAMIRYSLNLKANQSIYVNTWLCGLIFVGTLPFIPFIQNSILDLSPAAIGACMGIGALTGFGLLLNFEAFRRIDGFLAFLMFNISILITFMVETFYLKQIIATNLLITGGIMIVAASIVAEYINSKCEKQGL